MVDTHTDQQYWAVIPAAGVGSRMQADLPKQYLQLHDKTILGHTLQRFLDEPSIHGIVVVISDGDPYWPAIAQSLSAHKPVLVASGGQERCDSVFNGLQVLADRIGADDWVLVHDAARPCLTRQDIEHLVTELSADGVGGILARQVHDTMKRDNGAGVIAETVERRGLWHALTPQMFRFHVLYQALEQALEDGYHVTDEASAIEHLGLNVRLVEGRPENIKITRPEDLRLAELYLELLGLKSES